MALLEVKGANTIWPLYPKQNKKNNGREKVTNPHESNISNRLIRVNRK